jgi:endonuclease/exonuclease/phosphatase family metal-dependent hydrolase
MPSDAELGVVTWNISYEPLTPPGVLPWDARRDSVAEVLRPFDVIALQELSGRQLSDLGERLPDHQVLADRTALPDGLRRALAERFRLAQVEPEMGELALLVRRDRLVVEAVGASWLSPTPDAPLSIGWGNEVPRQLLWATVRDLLTGVSWLAATTHVDLTAVRRMTQAVRDQLAEQVAQVDAAVLLGDLNTMADPDAYRVLLDAGWRDTHVSLDLSEDPTFLGDLAGRPGRIDHILIEGGIDARDWRQLANPRGTLSDHVAVAATISLAA